MRDRLALTAVILLALSTSAEFGALWYYTRSLDAAMLFVIVTLFFGALVHAAAAGARREMGDRR